MYIYIHTHNHVPEGTRPCICTFLQSASLPHSISEASYWIFIILGQPHFWVMVMIRLSAALLLYFTYRWHASHTWCSWHHRISNPGTQRWGVIWIDPLSFSLLPTPPILLTNDSGSVIWYVYTYGPSYWSQWVKGSELEEGWVKGFNNHWIFHPHRTRNSVLFFVLLLDSGMKSCHLVPLPLTCV